MTTEATHLVPELRDDLRPLVGECVLIKMALEAVAAVAVQPPPCGNLAAGRINARVLLTLLTYSYATGTYASEDIEWDCQHDLATRYISGNAVPDRDTLRAFRRANRPWIEACLARMLDQVRDSTRTVANQSENGGSDPEVLSESRCLELARRRVGLATMMDMAMND